MVSSFIRFFLIAAGIGSLAGALTAESGIFVVDSRAVREAETHRFTSYADILENARAAVGLVRAESMRAQGDSSRDDLLEELFRRFHDSPEELEEDGFHGPEGEMPFGEMERGRPIPHGIGSGVIISSGGLMLTNNHVIATAGGRVADTVRVFLEDRGEYTARVLGRDRRTDIALLQLDGDEAFPYLIQADSGKLRVGDLVFAVGNPLGLGQTSTMGIVSALGRTDLGLLGAGSFEDFIQTDAAINRGNSGGALVDAAGRLVGINTAIFSRSGGNIGIGFAVPINMAREVARELFDYGEVQRGFLGVSIRNLEGRWQPLAQRREGVFVERADSELPAGAAGLQRGDIIIAVDGRKVVDVNSLRFLIANYRPGERVEIRFLRDGEEREATVVLAALDPPTTTASLPLPGLELQPAGGFPGSTADGLEERPGGLIVTRVQGTSAYVNLIEEGSVILEVNGHRVDSLADLSAAFLVGRVNTLRVHLRGDTGYITLQPR